MALSVGGDDAICMEDFLVMIERLPQDIQAQFETIQQLTHNNREILAHKKQEFLLKLHVGEIKGEAEIELERQVIRNCYKKCKGQSDECIELLNDLHQLLQCYLQHFDTEFAEWREQLSLKMPGLVIKLEKYSSDIHKKRAAAAILMQNMQQTQDEQQAEKRNADTFHKKLQQQCKKLLRVKQPKFTGKEQRPEDRASMETKTIAVLGMLSNPISATLMGRRTLSRGVLAPLPFAQAQLLPMAHQLTPVAVAVSCTVMGKKYLQDLQFVRRTGYKLNFQFVTDFHEKLDCICQKLSCGIMLACDNQCCPYKWFHFKCVNPRAELTAERHCCPLCSKIITPGAACSFCELKQYS